MYQCRDCGYRFENAQTVFEKHGLTSPPYERIAVCPNCRGTDFSEINERHCRCCGARLPKDRKEYCGERCKARGERMWARERARRRFRTSDKITAVTAELEAYNKATGSCLTYGQYVAKREAEKRVKKK